MPSITERVEQELQRKRLAEEAAKKEKDLGIRQAQESYLASQALQEQQRLAEIQRLRLIAEPVFGHTRIVEQMKEIESRYLRRYKRHAVAISWRWSAATLAWGSAFKIGDDGQFDYEKNIGIFDIFSRHVTGYQDYSFCRVHVDPETRALSFSNGPTLELSQWRQNPQLVSDCLAESYLNPNYVFKTDEIRPERHTMPSEGVF